MSIPKTGSKYYGLYQLLRRSRSDAVRLSFREMEAGMGERLPASASTAGFWSNRSSGALQAAAWMQAGYRVASVDLRAGVVTFERLTRTYTARREAGVVAWDSDLIRALRRHLGVNQAGLADLLGVRQQTVSEWETGMYAPTRSRSKHLGLVAERVGFPYLSERGGTKKRR
ncbi:MAG: hypothetical protein A2Y93_12875 [Chloroflexi bacterium RBG_13_68_17]|nr:MAG: hypothetical protein A2Y93_12875 [Chloroflexi bacterium RBG_13_68_17]